MDSKRILTILTNQGFYPSGTERTGLWLGELVHIFDLLNNSNYKVDIVSPRGGKIPLDPVSLRWPFIDRLTRSYLADSGFMEKLEKTPAPGVIDPSQYLAIYYAGGHGAMWDFPDNLELINIARIIYDNGGVIAAMCHGCAGLLNIKIGQNYLINKKNVTGFSWREEILSRRSKMVPFNLQEELKRRGALYSQALPLMPHVVTDDNLITGQNPQSSRSVAIELLHVLNLKQ